MNKKWYDYIPHPVVMLFGMIVLGYILTLLVPSGEFERLMVDGRGKVIPGTFHEVEKPQLNPEATEKVSHSQSGCNCDKVNIQILPYRIFVFEKYLDLL